MKSNGCQKCIAVAGTAVLFSSMAIAQMAPAGGAQNSTPNAAPGASRPMQDGMSGQNGSGAAGSMSSMGGASPAMDKKFVKTALAGGMAEVQMGQLATQKGSSDAVKTFGQKMVDDHTKMGDDLKPIAQKMNVPVPTKLDSKDQALYTRLQAMSGTSFDNAYVKAMVKDHKKDEADFKMESQNAVDPDLKQLATKGAGIISEHLEMIEGIAKSSMAGK